MNRASLIPISASRSFSKVEKPLRGDSLPEYLRQSNLDLNQEFESVYVPSTGLTVYPTVVDSLTCLPVYNGQLMPTTSYQRMGIGIKFHSSYAGKIIYLYRPKMTYGSGSVRNDTINYRADILSAQHLKVGSAIRDVVKNYKGFRITLPYEKAPDKIAQKVYGDYTLWHVIMQYNGFIYPEHCELDTIIQIPDYNEVSAWLKQIQPDSSNAMQYKGARVRL